MNVPVLALVVAVVLLAAAVAWFAVERRRSNALRERFGPEYARTVRDRGNRRDAEAELEARSKRVEALEIRPLEPAERERFLASWRTVQARFVDEPFPSVEQADALVAQVMEARGYPVGDFEQRAADVSVDHPQVVDHYRVAHRIATTDWGAAPDTEALRQAMVHYRALFSDLLDVSDTAQPATGPTARTARSTDSTVPAGVTDEATTDAADTSRRTR